MESKTTIIQLPRLTNNTKDYKIKDSTVEYDVKVGKTKATGFFIIIAKSSKEESNCYHIGEFCLNDLLDLNKAFWIYDSVDEVLKEVHDNCNKKKPSITSNKKGELYFNIVIETYRSIDEINFPLIKKYIEEPKKINNNEDDSYSNKTYMNESMIKEFKDMKNEINKLRGEINLLKINLEAKDEIIAEKQRIIEEKIMKEKMVDGNNNDKDEKQESLMKRVEAIEAMGKKFEEFMQKYNNKKDNSHN